MTDTELLQKSDSLHCESLAIRDRADVLRAKAREQRPEGQQFHTNLYQESSILYERSIGMQTESDRLRAIALTKKNQ